MKKQPTVRKTDAALAASLLPARKADGNKGTFGRALLFCGSEQYRGAACLAAEGARDWSSWLRAKPSFRSCFRARPR